MNGEPFRIGQINVNHPGARERENGEESQAFLTLDRRLRGGRMDFVPLSEDDLVRLLVTASKALAILRDVR